MGTQRRPIPVSVWVLALVLLFGIEVAIAFPQGEFPLNDDWGYSTPVRWWNETGIFRLTFWQSMTLIAQLGLGMLWSEVFGFGYMNLRLLVACLGLLSILTVFFIVLRSGVDRTVAFLAAGVLLAVPLFLPLTLSFMTDVPCLAFTLISVGIYAEYLMRPSRVLLVLGTTCLAIGLLVRQTTIAVAVGFACAEMYRHKWNYAKGTNAALVLLVAVVVVLGFKPLLLQFSELPTVFDGKSQSMRRLLSDLTHFAVGALIPGVRAAFNLLRWLGVFMLPLLPLIVLRRGFEPNRKFLLIAVALSAAMITASVVLNAWLPVGATGNILTPEGLGPRLIKGSYDTWSSVPQVLSIVGSISVSLVLARLLPELRTFWVRQAPSRTPMVLVLLVVTATFSYLPYGLFYGAWFDRYALVPCTLLVACIVVVLNKSIVQALTDFPQSLRFVSALLLFAGVGLSSLLAHDFFSWQRARCSLTERASTHYKLSYATLDGGFEYNNLQALLADPARATTGHLAMARDRPFLIAKQVLPGYELVSSQPTAEILNHRKIFLLHRVNRDRRGLGQHEARSQRTAYLDTKQRL